MFAQLGIVYFLNMSIEYLMLVLLQRLLRSSSTAFQFTETRFDGFFFFTAQEKWQETCKVNKYQQCYLKAVNFPEYYKKEGKRLGRAYCR